MNLLIRLFLSTISILALSCANQQKAPVSTSANPEHYSDEGASDGDEKEAEEEPTPVLPVAESSYSFLGKSLRSQSEDAVIQEASKILAKNPKDLKALNAIAVMYIMNRKLDMAKIVLARAIKSYPNDPTLACNLGIVNVLEDRIPEAIGEFQRALSSDQGHTEASYHLGAIHLRYKNGEAAVPLLQRAYSKLPKTLAGPHYAEALRLARRSKEAEEVYKDLKTESSRDTALVLGYASLLVEDIKDKKRGLKMVDRIRLISEDAGILKRADDLASKGEALR